MLTSDTTLRSPEELAEEFVAVTPVGIALRAPGVEPVHICEHPNQSLVKERAEKIRAFLAAVIRATSNGE